MSETLKLGDVLEDALVALARSWRALAAFWLTYAAGSALLWAGAGVCFMSFDRSYKLPTPFIVIALIGWAAWWLSTPLVHAALAARLAPAICAALEGGAPRSPRFGLPILRAAVVFGGMRVGLTAAGGLPGLWWMAAAGMAPAIMACEGLEEAAALRRALALSRGARGLIGTGVAAVLLGGVGLCLSAAALAWVSAAWDRDLSKLAALLGAAAALIGWMSLEAALLATFYHRLHTRRDREALEAVFA